MDELEIKIVLSYKVPKNGLTLSGILRGFEQDKEIMMRSNLKAILHALEEKAVEEQKIREPGRYIRYGRRKRGRKFLCNLTQKEDDFLRRVCLREDW